MKSAVLFGILLYLALLLSVYWFQDRLVLLSHVGRLDPFEPQISFEEVRIPTSDGETLSGWFFPQERPRATVLLFHGNAGHIGHRLPYASLFHELGYALLLVDYRGYGKSSGSPEIPLLPVDARAAWSFLKNHRGASSQRTVLVGESLGGAVAARLGAEIQPAAVVLASTFLSLPEIARDHFPWLPWRLIFHREPLDTEAAIRSLRCPVLIAHSPRDEIVPFRHAERLFALASDPKAFLTLDGGHNEGFLFSRPEWIEQLERFLKEHLQKPELP